MINKPNNRSGNTGGVQQAAVAVFDSNNCHGKASAPACKGFRGAWGGLIAGTQVVLSPQRIKSTLGGEFTRWVCTLEELRWLSRLFNWLKIVSLAPKMLLAIIQQRLNYDFKILV